MSCGNLALVAAHPLPASEPKIGPRRRWQRGQGSKTRVPPTSWPQDRSPWRADAGRLAREETIMTQDKARKVAARQRMTETGEPYSVARHAVQDEHDAPEGPRPDDWDDSPAAAAAADDIMADADQMMAGAW